MQQVVERLLGLAALEKRQTLQQVEAIDLYGLIGELMESREPRLREKSLTIEREGDTDVTCQGERFLLQQALGNLLDNAIDFSPSGGEISITTETQANQLQITISDQGPGIPDYAADRLFERFYSLPRPDGSGKSTGLGLAFVREVAELHGGEIRLLNRSNDGAVAVLVLPLTRGAGAPADASRRRSGVTRN
jgi:two-component system sensor histidine kinase CreC